MAIRLHRSTSSQSGNVGTAERLRSTLAGLGHTLSVVRSHLTHAHSTASGAGGKSTRDGMKEQWQRIRAGFGSTAHAIDSMNAMYRAELHDLHSAEAQVCALADEIWVTFRNELLAQCVSEYAAELRLRGVELETLLTRLEAGTREHPDQAMHALVHEGSRMAEMCADNVRDAAMVAALQRIIHYMIASYGTIAAHAGILGRSAEAAQFNERAERDKLVDAELSMLAKSTLNPQAAAVSTENEPVHRRGN